MVFSEHLRLTKGNIAKAYASYRRERRWRDPDWYAAWENGLADEVVAAVNAYPYPEQTR